MKIACLHTAPSHVAGFFDLFAQEGWEGDLGHVVRPDLLARAQAGDVTLADDLRGLIAGMDGGVILCTCSTLGPIVEGLGDQRVLRIDRPAMETAAAFEHVMLAICLESTQAPSVALLQDLGAEPNVVLCAEAWPQFEAGDMDGFHRRIAARVKRALIDAPKTDCIVLGQASMRGAAVLLADTGLRVLTTPVLAVRRAISIARR